MTNQYSPTVIFVLCPTCLGVVAAGLKSTKETKPAALLGTNEQLFSPQSFADQLVEYKNRHHSIDEKPLGTPSAMCKCKKIIHTKK